MTIATAAAKTASSQKSDLIPRGSSRGAFAARLVAAHRFEALGDGRHLEGDRYAGELLQLRRRVGRLLRARVEVALHPEERCAQVLAVTRLVAREQRGARIEKTQAQVLAYEIRLCRRQERRLAGAHLAHDHELRELAPHLGAEARDEAALGRAARVRCRRRAL